MSQILSDTPITSKNDDLLNRRGFANAMANAIIANKKDDSVCIGLYGPWGSGKTSVINMISESVKESPDTIVFRFNPWLCQDSRQMVSEFFKQFAGAIDIKAGDNKALINALELSSILFSFAGASPVAGNALSKVGSFLKNSADYTRKVTEADLQKTHDTIVSHLKNLSCRILIIIDDIDRLSYAEIISVFQLVKSLADFPHTVYILSFDDKVVEKALEDVQKGSGRKYLEKIVQIPIALPEVEPFTIHQILFAKLNDFVVDMPADRWNVNAWAELFYHGIKYYIQSLRSVNRYINVLSIKFPLLADETDPLDLIALTCLQVFEPYVYSELPGMKNIIVGDEYTYDIRIMKEEREKLKCKIGEIFKQEDKISNVHAAEAILGILFPKVQNAMGKSYYGRLYDTRTSFNSGSISNPDCFDRYFILGLDKDSISKSLIDGMLMSYDEFEIAELLHRFKDENKVVRVLDSIENRIYAEPELVDADRATELFRILMNCYPEIYTEEFDGAISLPFSWRFLYCIEGVLNTMPRDLQENCIITTYKDESIPIKSLSLLLWELERSHGRLSSKADLEKDPEKQRVTIEALKEIETIFVNRCLNYTKRECTSGLFDPDFLGLLKRIDYESFRSIIALCERNDTSLVNLVSYGISHGYVLTGAGKRTFDFHKDYYDDLMDIEVLYHRMCSFINTNEFNELSKEKQLDVAAFLYYYENKDQPDVAEYTTENIVHNRLDRIAQGKQE